MATWGEDMVGTVPYECVYPVYVCTKCMCVPGACQQCMCTAITVGSCTHSEKVLVTVQLTRAGNCRAQVRKRSPTGLQHNTTRRFFLTCLGAVCMRMSC